MIGHRYYQFLQFFITIITAFSSPQGQVNEFHLPYNTPFGSFNAAASSKDPTNALPMVTLDQFIVSDCTRV